MVQLQVWRSYFRLGSYLYLQMINVGLEPLGVTDKIFLPLLISNVWRTVIMETNLEMIED